MPRPAFGLPVTGGIYSQRQHILLVLCTSPIETLEPHQHFFYAGRFVPLRTQPRAPFLKEADRDVTPKHSKCFCERRHDTGINPSTGCLWQPPKVKRRVNNNEAITQGSY